MSEVTTTEAPPREKLTKKAITADHPTWCPGCGDFAVLASFYKVLEKKNLDHEKIVTLAGIGCSSRFPYFVNGHGAHFIHGRGVPLASGISLARFLLFLAPKEIAVCDTRSQPGSSPPRRPRSPRRHHRRSRGPRRIRPQNRSRSPAVCRQEPIRARSR